MAKAHAQKNSRTRDKAEVFTPSWICNAQNNLVDEHWFGRPKVQQQTTEFYDSKVSSQKPFGLRTYVVPTEDGDIQLRYNKGIGPFKRELVTGAFDWIDKWKVIMSYLTYDHARRADKDGKRRIFSTMEVLPPKVVCTEIYIVVDTFNSEIEAKNLLQYLKTKFVRFLVAQVTTTQHISKANFALGLV